MCPVNTLHPISNALLHHRIIRHLLDTGCAPRIDELAAELGQPRAAIVGGLKALQEYHGVVLHPASSEVWVIHPFATAPTNFWVQSGARAWWGNCASCSLGVAALAGGEVSIVTTLGGESQRAEVRIRDGRLLDEQYFVHFPIPMKHAWDNVVYTCSTMLLFDSIAAVHDWSERHRIPVGDIQPLPVVWEFARTWYGRHPDQDWVKWTAAEAKEIFLRFGLTGPVWDIPGADERF